MAHTDLERVQADLAAMKAVCVEPAIPTEEIVPNLILAAFGALLMAGTFFLPRPWITASVLLGVGLGTVAYIALKRRVLRGGSPGRRLEIKEAWVSAIGGVATVGYVIWFRFAVSGSRESLRLMFPGLLFMIGVTIVAYCVVGSRRMYYLGTGIAAAIGGLVLHFAAGPTSFHTILFGTWVATGLSNATCLWWAARRQRSEHGGG